MLFIKKIHVVVFSFIYLGALGQNGYVNYVYKKRESPFSDKKTSHNALLNFNNNESLFVLGKFGMDKESKIGELKHDSKNAALVAATSSEKGKMIYRNFKTKEISYNEFKLAIFPPYVVKDNWVEIQWNFINETKVIAGYKTKKATTTFRGTKYTVWYTDEISLPYGPHKLFGLPGLILESITHLDNDIVFTANIVCYPCENVQLIEQPKEIIVKSIEEEVEFKDNFQYYFNTEFNNQMKDLGILYLDEIPTEKKIQEKRKILTEKIYEWESKETKRLKEGIDYKKLLDPNRKKEKPKPANDLYFRPEPMHTQRF